MLGLVMMRKSDGKHRLIIERATTEMVGHFTAKTIHDWLVANYIRVPNTRTIGWILKHLHREGVIVLVDDFRENVYRRNQR
jgi:hypothetical protein